jgi:hypothetical protein
MGTFHAQLLLQLWQWGRLAPWLLCWGIESSCSLRHVPVQLHELAVLLDNAAQRYLFFCCEEARRLCWQLSGVPAGTSNSK